MGEFGRRGYVFVDECGDGLPLGCGPLGLREMREIGGKYCCVAAPEGKGTMCHRFRAAWMMSVFTASTIGITESGLTEAASNWRDPDMIQRGVTDRN